MWPSLRSCVPRNHAPVRPLMARAYKLSPTRTTQIVVGFRNVPARRSDAISNSSAVPILLSSSIVHGVIYGSPLVAECGMCARPDDGQRPHVQSGYSVMPRRLLRMTTGHGRHWLPEANAAPPAPTP